MGDVIDRTQVPVGDADADDSTSDVKPDAGASAESGKTALAQQTIDSLLTKYDLETPEDLGNMLDKLSGVASKVGDQDIDELIQSKNLLVQYQAQWAAEEEQKKREAETPEETINRLSKELSERDNRAAQEKKRREEEKANEKLISSFNSFVSKEVKGLKDVGDHLKPFLTRYLGVNNPIHDHDLDDRAGIKSLVADAGKAMLDLEKAILAKHGVKSSETKTDTPTPPVSTDGESISDSGTEGEPQIKNLKQARKVATASLLAKLRRS